MQLLHPENQHGNNNPEMKPHIIEANHHVLACVTRKETVRASQLW